MTVKASTCIEVGIALTAGVSSAADVGVRLIVLHKNGCITEVAITAASGLRISKVSRRYKPNIIQNLQIAEERALGFVGVVQMLEEIVNVVVRIVAYETGAWPVSLQMELIVEIETEIGFKDLARNNDKICMSYRFQEGNSKPHISQYKRMPRRFLITWAQECLLYCNMLEKVMLHSGQQPYMGMLQEYYTLHQISVSLKSA